jgi:hypothetical protein
LQAEVVSDLADKPQPAAMPAGPGGITGGIGLCLRSCASRCGLGRAVVDHLAVQCAVACPDQQPPVTGAVANRVDRELMNGKNDVTSTELGHAGLVGVGSHRLAQRIQRPGIENLIQDRSDVRAGHRGRAGSCGGFSGLAPGLLRLTAGIIGHGQSPG